MEAVHLPLRYTRAFYFTFPLRLIRRGLMEALHLFSTHKPFISLSLSVLFGSANMAVFRIYRRQACGLCASFLRLWLQARKARPDPPNTKS